MGPTMKERMEYYLGRKVSEDEVEQALEWQEYNEGVDLAEYVDAMKQIGAL